MRRESGIFRSSGVSVILPSAAICTMVALEPPGGTMMGTLARPCASVWIGPNSRPPALIITRELGAAVTGKSARPTSGSATEP
jgi:hypothetical protein